MVCHFPPGNEDNPQEIIVGPIAALAHVELHPMDHLGSCDKDPVCAQRCFDFAFSTHACFAGPDQIQCQKDNVVSAAACVANTCEPK